jgi:hypothetical protein
MDRKNLSRSYIKQVGVRQVMDDASEQRPPAPMRPISAGGVTPGGAPAGMSQEYCMFVDGTDEIPDRLRGKVWGIITRMNALTYIPDYMDFERLYHGVQAILINMTVNDEITLKDNEEILYYVGIQLRKSVKGIERKLISPVYTEVAHQELTSRSILEETRNSPAATGLMSRIGSKMRV